MRERIDQKFLFCISSDVFIEQLDVLIRISLRFY
jgi:hypothetical protein